MPVWLHVTFNFAVWKYGSMEEVKDERMEEVKDGRMEVVKYGRMQEVKDGMVEVVKYGRMEEVKDGRMEVALNGWDSHLYNPLSLREGLASETDLNCLVSSQSMRLQTDRSMEGRKNGKSEEWKDGSLNEVEVWDGPSRLP